MASYKITKVKLNDKSNYKAFNDLRKEDQVMQVLRETGQEMGDIETSYKGFDRSHVIVKMDKETYNRYVAEGKITPKDKGENGGNG
jgi:hypothetical protein